MDEKRVQTFFFLFILLGTIIVSFFVLKPFLYSLILAAAIAIVFLPVQKTLTKAFRGKNGVAAIVTTLSAFIIILIPLGFFGTEILLEGKNLYETISKYGTSEVVAFFENAVRTIIPSFDLDFGKYAEQFALWIVNNLGPFFSGVTKIITGLVISFLALFFFLKDWERIRSAILAYSPLENKLDKDIIKTLTVTIRSVVKGSLVIAVCQGFAAGLGFWLLGLPNPAVWGLMAVFAALIPFFGTMIIVFPASLYLFFISSPIAGIVLFLWGALIVSSLDNILRPILMEREVKIHPFMIFLSVIGGLQFFGPIGFLLGPLVFGLLFALLNIYKMEME